MKVGKLPGVGKVTEQELNALGIEALGQPATYDRAELRERFGDSADVLREKALGHDASGWFELRIAEKQDPSPSAMNTPSTKTQRMERSWNPR